MSRGSSEHPVRNLAHLARSSVRLPWTLSLWGVQVASRLLDPRSPTRDTAANLDALSEAARQPLDGPLDNLRRAGDHLQGGMIDAAADLVSSAVSTVASGSVREPHKAIEQAWGVLGRSWDLFLGERGGKR